MKNAHAAIAGLRLRLDVPTKCRIVELILTRTFESKKALNDYISIVAVSYNVNPVTVKLWVSKYATTYKAGKQLPKGTMSFTFTTLNEKKIPKAEKSLLKLRNELNAIKAKYHPDIKRTPNEILDELISTKEH